MQRYFIFRTSSSLFNTKNYTRSIKRFNNVKVSPFMHIGKAYFHPNISPKARKTHFPVKSISAIAAATIATSYYYHSTYNNSKLDTKSTSSFDPNTLIPSNVASQLNDDNSRVALQAKSIQELLLALFVYKSCTFSWLVDAAPNIVAIAETFYLQAPVYWFIKNTFFRYFCGGEVAEECVSTMTHLLQSDINCILDLSIEADLHIDNTNESQIDKSYKHWQHEQRADATLKMMKTCIKTAAQGHQNEYSTSRPFAALKITAFAPLDILLRVNQVVFYLNQAFEMYQLDGRVDSRCVDHVVSHICPPAYTEIQNQQRIRFLSKLKNQHETLGYDEYTNLFSLNGPNRKIWWETDRSKPENEVLLTQEDLEAYDRMVERLGQVCQLAYKVKVGIMIDAEQSYFQEAIDYIAMNLQQKFNRIENKDHIPTVYNTYQMYTKTAQAKIERDVERANKGKFTFAAKLVRGAYMVSERKRAQELNCESPIHDTIEDTHNSYNNSIRFLLNKLQDYQEKTGSGLTATNAPIVFVVATHNRESTILTVEEMAHHHVLPKSGVVHFGQLYGMQDQISYTLAQNGYSVYKYLPYGTIDEVIPYLLRRAQENGAVLENINKECALIWEEIKERLLASIVFHSSSFDPSISTAAPGREYTLDSACNSTTSSPSNDRAITGASTEAA
ncbi:MAG: FAD-linked oxidoreductase-like protein [Benjaminiella poitrasii]|nr:MAG: FAD-linked oxidoreductase-like protein [Benjaminiella poitrasii]